MVLAEVFPSLLAAEVMANRTETGMVPDEAQVRLLAAVLWHMQETGAGLGALFTAQTDEAVSEDVLILGFGH